MADFLKSIFDWSDRILVAYSGLVKFFSKPLIEYLSEDLQNIFETFYWIFDIPNKLIQQVLGLPAFYDLTVFELLIEAVFFVCFYTLITWVLDVV